MKALFAGHHPMIASAFCADACLTRSSDGGPRFLRTFDMNMRHAHPLRYCLVIASLTAAALQAAVLVAISCCDVPETWFESFRFRGLAALAIAAVTLTLSIRRNSPVAEGIVPPARRTFAAYFWLWAHRKH